MIYYYLFFLEWVHDHVSMEFPGIKTVDIEADEDEDEDEEVAPKSRDASGNKKNQLFAQSSRTKPE